MPAAAARNLPAQILLPNGAGRKRQFAALGAGRARCAGASRSAQRPTGNQFVADCIAQHDLEDAPFRQACFMHRAVDGRTIADVHVAIRLHVVYRQIDRWPGRAQRNDIDRRAVRPRKARHFAPIGLPGRLPVGDQDNAGQVSVNARRKDLFQRTGDVRFLAAGLFGEDLFGNRSRLVDFDDILLIGQRACEAEDAQLMLRQQVAQQTGRRPE